MARNRFLDFDFNDVVVDVIQAIDGSQNKFLLLTYTEIVSYIIYIYIYIIREYFCTHRSRIFNCNTVTL